MKFTECRVKATVDKKMLFYILGFKALWLSVNSFRTELKINVISNKSDSTIGVKDVRKCRFEKKKKDKMCFD